MSEPRNDKIHSKFTVTFKDKTTLSYFYYYEVDSKQLNDWLSEGRSLGDDWFCGKCHRTNVTHGYRISEVFRFEITYLDPLEPLSAVGN